MGRMQRMDGEKKKLVGDDRSHWKEGEGEWWMREVERERSEREAREEGREKVEEERVRK